MKTLNLSKQKAQKAHSTPPPQAAIQVDRDSICMGDDCLSHEVIMTLSEDTHLSELMQMLADYVPTMKNVIWAIRSDIAVCGYIITDSDANASFELCGADIPIKEMEIHEGYSMTRNVIR
ncbi:MAG: hypothetical protein NC092_02965 [Butyrivibrio sp.]|nr:hypothetical protein [Muribaculum sp.]MCM1551634.1 hypothetical protein [Butyrivibrio sp.]